MKKTFIIIFSALLYLTACDADLITPIETDPKTLNLNLTINCTSDPETKATKTTWEDGDKIFIFFKDVTVGYLTVTYNGVKWVNPQLCGITVDNLTESGSTLTAIYLPYGNDATPTYSTKWVFDKAIDSYYLKAQKQSYTITKTNGIATLSATLNMAQPGRFIQLFVPDENASGTAYLSCNNICPQGLGSVAADGTCKALVNSTLNGENITGYAATINGDKGYYFYGTYYPFSQSYKLYYYFTLEKDGKYYDYLTIRKKEVSDGAAIILPSMRQVGTGFYTNATIGGYTWATTNYGSSKPWEYDAKQYTWPGGDSGTWEDNGLNDLVARGEAVPSADQINALCSGTTKIRIMAGGVVGYLVYDSGTKGYLFLACSGYYEGTKVGDCAYCWTSTEYTGEEAKFLYSTVWDVPQLHNTGIDKTKKLSIRAVKNN